MIETEIQQLTAAINNLTAALLSKRDLPATPVEAPKAETPAPEADEPKVEKPKAEKKEPKADKPKSETPKAETPKKEEPKAETTALPDLSGQVQAALKPILAQKKLAAAKDILAKVGGGAANFASIPREKQQAVIDALAELEIS